MSLTGCLTPSYGPNLVNCGIFTSVHTPFPAFFILELDSERPVGRVLQALSSSPSGICNYDLMHNNENVYLLRQRDFTASFYACQAEWQLISIDFSDVKWHIQIPYGLDVFIPRTCAKVISKKREAVSLICMKPIDEIGVLFTMED